MAANQQLLITLPSEIAELLHRKVASGEYASESEVISDSLTLLEDHEEALEQWLREDVVPACIEFEANQSSGIVAADLLSALQADRKERQRS
jgi:antitoxin ParD1/3/4